MQNRLGYLSLVCGFISWALFALRCTSLLGNSFDTVFLFFPPAVLGFALALVTYFKGQNRKLATIGICINALPLCAVAIFIYLLTRPDAFRQ